MLNEVAEVKCIENVTKPLSLILDLSYSLIIKYLAAQIVLTFE